MEEHALIAPEGTREEDEGVEGDSVEFSTVGEEGHGAEDAVGEASALGGGSLGFVFEEIGETLEAHDLQRMKSDKRRM